MQNKLFYIESAQSQNRNWFSYVVNDPVNYVDLFGLCGSDITFSSSVFNNPIIGNDLISNNWIVGDGWATATSGATLNGFTQTSGVPWTTTSWDQSRDPKTLQIGETITWNTSLPFSNLTFSEGSTSTTSPTITAQSFSQSSSFASVGMNAGGQNTTTPATPTEAVAQAATPSVTDSSTLASNGKITIDQIQTVLDIIGFIPGLGDACDFANGVISLTQGDYVTAGMSFISMVPIVGDALGKGSKIARFGLKHADEVADAVKITRKQAFRQAKEAAGIPKSAQFTKHKFVFDGLTENRMVYEFDVGGKKKYIIEHAEDKFGRGPHFHGADASKGSPFNKGTYEQFPRHFPEDIGGFN